MKGYTLLSSTRMSKTEVTPIGISYFNYDFLERVFHRYASIIFSNFESLQKAN